VQIKQRHDRDNPGQPDYNQKFFLCLREQCCKPLLDFLRSIDPRATLQIAAFIRNYLLGPEDEIFAARRHRGRTVKKALSRAVRDSRNAAKSYRELGQIQIPEAGPIIRAPGSLGLEGMSSLAHNMEDEAARFSALLNNAKNLYNEKRFGVGLKHIWLILLQGFVEAWTSQELGKTKQLSVNDIADLMTAGKGALDWPENQTETDPELVHKAIRSFRSNPTNQWICAAMPKYVEVYCNQLKTVPYLLGIEI
jgi:hypothetical protein